MPAATVAGGLTAALLLGGGPHAGRPAGRDAVQAYHDEDGNGRLRKGLFGLPDEAIGFSRDARVRLGPPSSEDAAIDIAEPATATRLRLRHVGM